MTGVESVVLLAVAGVVVVGLVSTLSEKVQVAAPLLLVLVGVVLGFPSWTPTLEVEPDVILTVVLPPLIYAAAVKVPYVDFRRNLKVIASLAVVLVVLSGVGAALVVHGMLPGVPLALALALGAVVSPPDAVAAISLGKRLGLPPRVVTILEGEGLVNDATALVMLATALGVATSSQAHVSALGVLGSFLWSVVGAVLTGFVIGALAIWARRHLSDAVLDIAIALVVPFLSFLAAEAVDASGVVSVVVSGLLVGNLGTSMILASRRRAEQTNWASFTMLVENGVFLLMGYLLPPEAREVTHEGQLGRAVLVGVLVSLVLIAIRFAYFPLVLADMRRSARKRARRHDGMVDRFKKFDPDQMTDQRMVRRIEHGRMHLLREKFDITAERDQALGWRDSVVLGMAGMRGVVTIAAAQTLPSDHPEYRVLVLVAFIVALTTLIPQGLLLPVVVNALHLQADSDERERTEYAQLMLKLSDIADRAIQAELEAGDVDPVIEEGFRTRLRDRVRRTQAMEQHQEKELTAQFTRLRAAQLDAETRALAEERR